MKINPIIFKSYDIRGIYPTDLNEDIAFRVGQAIVRYTKAEKVAVGRDMRLSSPMLFPALVNGILSQGASVVNFGEIPMECSYFAMGKYGYKAVVVITASHNPKEYNGFKMLKGGVDVIRGKDMEELVTKGDFPLVAKKKNDIEDFDILQEYLDFVFQFIDVSRIKSRKIVIDAGNGMAGKMIPLLQDKIPVEIIPLNFTLDGNFPAHPSNPLEKGATDQLSKEVLKRNADVGFIFDGDADRIFLVDEKGQFVRGDITLLLLAKHFLQKTPGAAIAYNAICSKAVPLFIKKWGGKPIRTAVGAVNIKKAMLQEKGLMGGEVSGHYNFKDNFYSDSGALAFLALLEMLSINERKLSEMVKEISPYAKSAEINFEIQDKQGLLEKVKQHFLDAKQDYLDGVTVEYKDWWFNVRPSNTEPLVRLTIEANTPEILSQKQKDLIDFIQAQKS